MAQGAGVLVADAYTPWGKRYGKFIDPFGHVWSVSHRIAKADVKPAPVESVEAAVADIDADIDGVSVFSMHEPQADRVAPSAAQDAHLSSEETLSSHAA